MTTELNFAKLIPTSFASANASDMNTSMERSMLLSNIRHGQKVDHIITGLGPEYLPDWVILKSQCEALEHGGVTSTVSVWHRVCQDDYRALMEPWNANGYQGMVGLTENATNPGPINGAKPDGYE